MSDVPDVPEKTTKPSTIPNNNLREPMADFKNDSSPLEILTKLVNNEYLADVVFKVGRSGTLMYAHKNIITLASEVFFAQFNGQFIEAQQDLHMKPIVMKDIEPSTFQEVLSYIYCRQVTLTADNMVDVYYAAHKYLLKGLQVLCEDAFRREIGYDNVLQIFQYNRRYNHKIVDELCLSLICDNPLKIFRLDGFKELDLDALQIIVEQKGMNCHASQLEQAIADWACFKGSTKLFVEPRVRLCRRLKIFGRPEYSTFINTDIKLKVKSRIALYGVGIFVGVRYDTFVPLYFVTIKVKINQAFVAGKSVDLSNDLETCEFMFEKVNIDDECTIQIVVEPSYKLKHVGMFYLSECNLADTLGTSQLIIEYLSKHKGTCISYLLCQADN